MFDYQYSNLSDRGLFLGCVVQLSKQQEVSWYKILNFVTFYARLRYVVTCIKIFALVL